MVGSLLKRVRFALAFVLVLLAQGLSGPALARPARQACHAVTSAARAGPPAALACGGTPADYRNAALWLTIPLGATGRDDGTAVVVNATRFDRLAIGFTYADGFRSVQQVRQGDFGDHWHSGDQIAFVADRRAAALTGVLMRIDHLASYDLLRIRVLPARLASRQFELCAALVGGALALLMVGMIYNLGVAVAVRRRFFLWHGLWASAVFVWGLLWSQLALVVVPGVAGTSASRLSTVLACLAVLLATLSALRALRHAISVSARRVTLALGVAVVALGVLADLPGVDLDLLAPLVAAATLGTLAAVTGCLIVAWRRGFAEARELAKAWALPMLVLAATQIFDFNTILFGGGAQIAVLFASALQTIALSLLATRRLGRLRIERDAAVAAEAVLAELADRDPLTGLLNRRGFVNRCRQAFGDRNTAPFGLLLIDVDDFKSVNDRFGHEMGDTVLATIAAELRRLERQVCLAGRMGGEEFVIGVSGLTSFALWQFAEHVRATIAACDHGEVSRHRRVSVSIGVAEGIGSTPFQTLYGAADRALYEAKRAGRDCVVFRPHSPFVVTGQLALPFLPG